MSTKIERGKELIYLSLKDVLSLGISRAEVIDVVRQAMVEHGNGRYEMPAKIGIHPYEDVFFHAMPAYLPELKAAGAKWIECYPRNPREYGLPQTTGLMVMNDVETGVPTAVMDCTWLTAMRTPAVTVLAGAALHPDLKTFGMFGCGIQGKEHVRYAAEHFDKLEQIQVFDSRGDVADALIAEVQPDVDVPIVKGDSIESVIKSCEVLSSATVILRDSLKAGRNEWVSPGQTILPCDLMTFWDQDLGHRADKFIVDSTDEHRLFEGMGYYSEGGLPDIYAETGEILAGVKPGRTSPDEIIVANNVGMAVCDVVVAQLVLARALERNVGVVLEL